MDVLDHLNERMGCGLCGRRIRYSDDFCSRCRRVTAGVPEAAELEAAVVVEAELATLLAVAS